MKHKENQPRAIFLKPWQEFVGTYKGIRTSGSYIVIVFSLASGKTFEIFLQRASVDGANVLRELRDCVIGRTIGILKVDDENNSVRIREDKSQVDEKNV